ncbi:unnamed protein product [Microthlaspi erraticum]|uniref:TRF2/HOY1 PH-like domain-containing protein n=1 Tax=Microthlaspi erraticum TaxID=1685480 RepID=A0A6D2HJJ2_9BRAS|nr:unnamed protein product [Microthlaspi erraticum]
MDLSMIEPKAILQEMLFRIERMRIHSMRTGSSNAGDFSGVEMTNWYVHESEQRRGCLIKSATVLRRSRLFSGAMSAVVPRRDVDGWAFWRTMQNHATSFIVSLPVSFFVVFLLLLASRFSDPLILNAMDADPPEKLQKTEAGSSAGFSSRNLQSRDRELPPTQQALPETNSPANQNRPYGIMDGENPPPPLNLRLTITPEFISKAESILNQARPLPRQQLLPDPTEITKTSTCKKSANPKPIAFPVSKITIGQWTHTAVHPDDLTAKCYFVRRKLMWEILDNVQTGAQVAKMKRKMEIDWADVLSLKTTYSADGTGTLEVELRKRPTFFMETNSQAGNQTLWLRTNEDFTLDESASKCRVHTLHFAPGVLEENFEKTMCSDSFWSELVKVPFPVSPPYFESGL